MMIARYKNGLDGMMPRTFNQMFDTVMNEATGGRSAQAPFVLRVDAWETQTAFELEAAVPGLTKEEISIELNDGKLTISGERKFERKDDTKYLILESSFGRFSRVFNLPENVNPDAISASFVNGVLKISLPKDEQKVLRRKIEITDNAPAPISIENNTETAKDDTPEKGKTGRK